MRMTKMTTGWTRAAMIVLMILGLVLGMGASCGDEKKGAEAQPPAQKEGAQGAANSGELKKGDPEDSATKIAADVYPGLNLESFNDGERSKFVGMAKAELCPCPESTVSLHECLRKTETQCGVAKYSAVIMASGIKEGKTQTDILDQVAKYVEGVKKTYEFDVAKTPYKGNPEAKVVLVEFADFQCPHCKMVVPIMDEVSEKYGDKIAFYYKHYPLPSHTQAEAAAAASLAAHQQGKFWEMHALIFKNQSSLSRAKLKSFAQQLGLNMNKFLEDFESPTIAAQINQDKAEATTAQIDGTPSLYINGKRYMGEKTVEDLSKYIDNALAGEGKE